ncbi:rCG42344, isoform CRA_a [Rattus norvegicus]|uniref:RCG42344, isoform CRA_a n=1 Tax=Rattus norvegicus TaxID=10116 RepID=A6KFX6_RAT|nr:rCG42344, isoform CRA_a [Rattus norvegicus]EDL88932.1 rCG42344, isoform CRA_a [Rattus norvegicus]EDL88933.1 rCG42344, isoform CRA_a [Rattus norvegicus]
METQIVCAPQIDGFGESTNSRRRPPLPPPPPPPLPSPPPPPSPPSCCYCCIPQQMSCCRCSVNTKEQESKFKHLRRQSMDRLVVSAWWGGCDFVLKQPSNFIEAPAISPVLNRKTQGLSDVTGVPDASRTPLRTSKSICSACELCRL